jgi:hypothetical protein
VIPDPVSWSNAELFRLRTMQQDTPEANKASGSQSQNDDPTARPAARPALPAPTSGNSNIRVRVKHIEHRAPPSLVAGEPELRAEVLRTQTLRQWDAIKTEFNETVARKEDLERQLNHSNNLRDALKKQVEQLRKELKKALDHNKELLADRALQREDSPDSDRTVKAERRPTPPPTLDPAESSSLLFRATMEPYWLPWTPEMTTKDGVYCPLGSLSESGGIVLTKKEYGALARASS